MRSILKEEDKYEDCAEHMPGGFILLNNSENLIELKETPSSKYRIMVFDKNGDIVFNTSDKAYCRNISIAGKTIYFYNISTGTICIGQLN